MKKLGKKKGRMRNEYVRRKEETRKERNKKLGGRKYEYRKEKERIKNVYAERKWMNEKR